MIRPWYCVAADRSCQVSVTGSNISGISTLMLLTFSCPPKITSLPLGRITGFGNFLLCAIGETFLITGTDKLLALKSNISTDVVAESVTVAKPPTTKILPFSEGVLVRGHRNVVP
jgi:hypothetical protein